MSTLIPIYRDPLTAGVAMVDRNTADVTIRQGKSVRIAHPDLRLAIGVYLLANNFTGNETIGVRTLSRRDWAEQSNQYTDPARTLTKAQVAKIRKESTNAK